MRRMTLITVAHIAATAIAMTSLAAPCSEPPPYPGMAEWTFRKELAKPESLPPVPTNDVTFVRAPVEGRESYRIDIGANGKVTIKTEDNE